MAQTSTRIRSRVRKAFSAKVRSNRISTSTVNSSLLRIFYNGKGKAETILQIRRLDCLYSEYKMTSDYKLYQGAVFAELLDEVDKPLSIRAVREEGRLGAYIIDDRVGLFIKHSAVRMSPWQFTFSKANALVLMELRTRAPKVFVVFVCWLDGMMCASLDELTETLGAGVSDQAWVRVERRRNKWYSVSGGAGNLSYKKPQGLTLLTEALQTP